ncbi:MAG: 2-hydroxyacyl-CoA dehydratase family protein [Rhodospirillales bacterium]|nr:2-hydroxyacyl-CoA dehydratase family protein [Rhodospirillales bacterium]
MAIQEVSQDSISKPIHAATMSGEDDMVGRGVKEGAELFRVWFNELSTVAENGDGAAYVFVMGSMNEVLKTFDMPVSFPEVNALQTAIRRVSRDYLNEAEDYGYSPDICGYVKADVAMQLAGGKHPMGNIPKPSIAVLTNACNTYIKWAEIWERLHKTPSYTMDIPGTRCFGDKSQPGSEDFKFEAKYVLGQIKELIELCEQVSGIKFDIDKFREVLGYANRMSDKWDKIIRLNANQPAMFNALTDGTVYLGMANGFRGTEEGAVYFDRLYEEMVYRAENDIGIRLKGENGPYEMDQQFRLAFVGVPCYPIFSSFNNMFTDWGGVFVTSSYLWFASGGTSAGIQYDLDNPLESFAEGQLLMVREAMDSMFNQAYTMREASKEFALDGVVYHPIKSCRTVSTGLADQRRYVSEELGLPTLFFESDLMDPQVVSEAQMKNRADAFFEGLISRRQQAVV